MRRIATAIPRRRRTVLLAGALLGGLAAAPALRAEAPTPGPGAGAGNPVPTAASAAADSGAASLRGKGARRTARFDRLIGSFQADRRAIYQQFGFPDYRYYELTFSVRTERWIYLAEDLEFVFAGDRLLSRE